MGGDISTSAVISRVNVFQSTPPRRRRRLPLSAAQGKVLFQSTPPRRRRPQKKRWITSRHYFNPRLRVGGDGWWQLEDGSWVAFQSTPPRGRRRGIGFPSVCCFIISIHASAREATTLLPHPLPSTLFQSTPPRGKRPDLINKDQTILRISIHASAREATYN